MKSKNVSVGEIIIKIIGLQRYGLDIYLLSGIVAPESTEEQEQQASKDRIPHHSYSLE